MNYAYLDSDVRDGVAHVSLLGSDEAPAGEFFDELTDCFLRLQEDRAARVVLLLDGSASFDVGFDLRGAAENWAGGEGPSRLAGDLDTVRRFSILMHELAKPVIAAVSGDVREAGFGLVMNADVRLAAPTATFTTGDMSTGMLPDWGLSHLLPRRIGAGRTLELFWSGRTVGAEEAARLGLVDRLVATDIWEDTVTAFAERLALIPQPALHLSKMTVQQSTQFDFTTALSLEFEAQERCWESRETATSLAAWLDGVTPDYGIDEPEE